MADNRRCVAAIAARAVAVCRLTTGTTGLGNPSSSAPALPSAAVGGFGGRHRCGNQARFDGHRPIPRSADGRRKAAGPGRDIHWKFRRRTANLASSH
jgi:hypothetical protein